MRKKIVAALLAGAMVFSMASVAFAAGSSSIEDKEGNQVAASMSEETAATTSVVLGDEAMAEMYESEADKEEADVAINEALGGTGAEATSIQLTVATSAADGRDTSVTQSYEVQATVPMSLMGKKEDGSAASVEKRSASDEDDVSATVSVAMNGTQADIAPEQEAAAIAEAQEAINSGAVALVYTYVDYVNVDGRQVARAVNVPLPASAITPVVVNGKLTYRVNYNKFKKGFVGSVSLATA